MLALAKFCEVKFGSYLGFSSLCLGEKNENSSKSLLLVVSGICEWGERLQISLFTPQTVAWGLLCSLFIVPIALASCGGIRQLHTHTHARTHAHTHTHTARQTALRWPWLLKLVNYLPAEYLQGSCKETAEEDEKSRYSRRIRNKWNVELWETDTFDRLRTFSQDYKIIFLRNRTLFMSISRKTYVVLDREIIYHEKMT